MDLSKWKYVLRVQEPYMFIAKNEEDALKKAKEFLEAGTTVVISWEYRED